ncbi:MAG: hypothetical protein K6E44_02870 [Bacteroidales bacterium]|nr:hypothetical protein [Bacteroidales bacterium]
MEDPNVPQQPQQPQAPQYAPQQPQYQQPQAPQYGPQPQYQQPYQQPQYQQYQPVQPKPVNGLGIAGFVLSLVGICFFWVPFFNAISSLIGLILSGFGMKKKPNGLAIAGLVIGIIAFIIGLIITIAAIVAVDAASDYVRYNGGFNW